MTSSGYLMPSSEQLKESLSLLRIGFTFPKLSPACVVSSYLTRFTLTSLLMVGGARFCGTFPRVAPGCR